MVVHEQWGPGGRGGRRGKREGWRKGKEGGDREERKGGERERGKGRDEERREEGEVKYMSLDKLENGKKIVLPIELWCLQLFLLLSPDSSLLTIVLFTLFPLLSLFFVSDPSTLKPIQLEPWEVLHH